MKNQKLQDELSNLSLEIVELLEEGKQNHGKVLDRIDQVNEVLDVLFSENSTIQIRTMEAILEICGTGQIIYFSEDQVLSYEKTWIK